MALSLLLLTMCETVPAETSTVAVYGVKEELPHGCVSLGTVSYKLQFMADAPEQSIANGELKQRTLAGCKERAATSGANALLYEGIRIEDAVGGAFSHECLAIAYKC